MKNWTKIRGGVERLKNGLYMSVVLYDGCWNASVVGLEIFEAKFKTRREAVAWCLATALEIE